MKRIVLQSQATALWQELVSEAAHVSEQRLDVELESYLVFLLMRYTEHPEIASRVLALDYLEGMQEAGSAREGRLREVGDVCLLLSGLFPQRAERRRVRIGYYVDLGRGAYRQVAENCRRGAADLYAQLAEKFVALMDILNAIRALDGSVVHGSPLAALELWSDTGSRQAFRSLVNHTGARALPVTDVPRKVH